MADLHGSQQFPNLLLQKQLYVAAFVMSGLRLG